MDGVNSYNKEVYGFTEETWRIIEFYEKLFSNERLIRIANYKEGGIPEEYIKWVEELINSSEFEKITQIEYDYHGQIKGKNKDRFYATNRLNKILDRNKYFMKKVSKHGLRFSYTDVKEFLTILKESSEKGLLREFLNIPDVWYIIRNLRENWNDVLGIYYTFNIYQSIAN